MTAAMTQDLSPRLGNQAVKRNTKRFPDDFMFQLTQEEWNILRSQIVTAKTPEDQTSCRSSVVSRRLADTCLQNYTFFGRIMCFSNKSLYICTKLRIR